MKGKFLMTLLLLLLPASTAWPHFGVIIPSDDIVTKQDSKKLFIELKFVHPFEGHYMQMQKPGAFGVLRAGKKHDLLQSLREKNVKGFSTWTAIYRVRRPGDHIFYVEPAPYWEPAEGSFIIHYTKVVVNALGMEKGWDNEVGLPVEIVPLTRPYGLWAGNVFQGIVKKAGKPVPNAEVEVEFLNDKDNIKADADPYITQVIKADKNGVFTYAMPRAGWWGFAALIEADYKLKHKGREYPVETGAVIWVRTRQMQGEGGQ